MDLATPEFETQSGFNLLSVLLRFLIGAMDSDIFSYIINFYFIHPPIAQIDFFSSLPHACKFLSIVGCYYMVIITIQMLNLIALHFNEKLQIRFYGATKKCSTIGTKLCVELADDVAWYTVKCYQ